MRKGQNKNVPELKWIYAILSSSFDIMQSSWKYTQDQTVPHVTLLISTALTMIHWKMLFASANEVPAHWLLADAT